MRLRVNTGLFVTVGESFGESRSTSALVQQSCFGTAVCVGCAKTSMEAMSVRGDTSMIGQFGVFRFGQGSCGEYVWELAAGGPFTVQTPRLFMGRSSEARRSSHVPSVKAVSMVATTLAPNTGR